MYKLTNGERGPRVVYDRHMKAHSLEPLKSKDIDLDTVTATNLEQNFRSGASRLKVEMLSKPPEDSVAASTHVGAPPPGDGRTGGSLKPDGDHASGGGGPGFSTDGRATHVGPATTLLAEVETGLTFFALRNRAKTILGEIPSGADKKKLLKLLRVRADEEAATALENA